MRWYIVLALISLSVLILTEESEGWWTSRRRSSQGCKYLYCYNGGTKYCHKRWWSSRRVPKCRCRSWTKGRQCQTITCPNKSCSRAGKAYCRNRGVTACNCYAGHYGSKCQYVRCQFIVCRNKGQRYCRRGSPKAFCKCRPGYRGSRCEKNIYSKYYLYTKSGLNGKKVNIGDTSFLRRFDGSRTTVFLIHGWRKKGSYSQWIKDSIKYLLRKNEVGNVIVAKWSSKHWYLKAVRIAKYAGEEMAGLIKYLVKKKKTRPARFYLVGFSLGAHVAGFAGMLFKKEKLGRITGLDPAGPFISRARHKRLDESDADFVDVIHTDAPGPLGLGTSRRSGHMDFWPNGGVNQRGCRRFRTCDHMRAPKYFVESIRSSCVFRAVYHRCKRTFRLFGTILRIAKCKKCVGKNCPEMGYNAIKYKGLTSGNFRLRTNANSPFCTIN